MALAPGEVGLAGLGEQLVTGVFEAVGQVEAGRAFGDQGAVPRPWAAGDLASGSVEGQLGGPDITDRPGPLGLQPPQQVPKVVRGVRGTGSQPARRLVQFRQQSGALVTVAGAGLLGEGQPYSRWATAVA